MSASRATSLLRPILVVLCLVATAWVAIVMVSGGFVLRFDGFRVSSRSPRNAAIIAVLTGLGAWALTPSGDRRRIPSRAVAVVRGTRRLVAGLLGAVVQATGRIPHRAAPGLAACAAVAVVLVALLRGAPYVGGSDVYGYVSQAHLWATGTLRVEQPFVAEMRWPFAADALTPLGYRPTPDGMALLPVYSPGLPLVMALFEIVGGREAVFLVVPLLGGVAVWATYLLGAVLAGRTVGVSAALLLASSPAFLFQVMFPMSDVPVTAWWALALWLATRDGRTAAFAAGLAAGAAILTRPNLVPLALIPGGLLLYRGMRRDPLGVAATRALPFVPGVLAACALMAIVNTRLWGSPLASGYGSADFLYSWENFFPNLQRYPRWLLMTQTPLVLLAVAAPWVLKNAPRVVALGWLCFIVVVFLSYLFHFPNETWFWLRYVLPAFPPLFVLTSAVLVACVSRLTRGARLLVVAGVVGFVAWHGLAFGIDDGIFRFRQGERKSLVVGEYIESAMPERAIFISRLHTGSIRYYSGRLTMHFEGIPPHALDEVLTDLRDLGYHPYIALEAGEEMQFRERFEARSSAGALDWPPAVLLDHSTPVRIYDPARREATTTVIR